MDNAPGVPAEFGARALRGCVLALPVLLVLFTVPAAESPFLLPKRALLIALSFALFAAAAACRALRPLERTTALVLALLPAACLISWLTSPRRDLGLDALLFVAAAPLLAWTAASVLRRDDAALLWVVAIAGAIEAAVVLLQWNSRLDVLGLFGYPAGAKGRMRLYGLAGNPDFAGIVMAATLPPVLLLARRAQGGRRYLLFAGAAVVGLAIAATGCRTALAAAAVGIVAATACDRAPSSRAARWMAALVVAAALLAATAWVRNPRPAGIAGRGRMFVSRVVLADAWKQALGAGPGTFAYRYPRMLAAHLRVPRDLEEIVFAGYERTPNNDFVQALSETGWLGLGALAILAGFLLMKLALPGTDPASSLVPAAALGSVAVLLTAGLAESPLQRAETWALLSLWLGLAVAASAPTRPAAVLARPRFLALRFVVAAVLSAGVAAMAARAPRASYWAAVGTRLEAQSHYAAAVDAYRRSIQIDPAASSAPFNLPRALAEVGDLDGATAAAIDGLRWIDEPELHLMRIRILEARGDYVAALQVASEAAGTFPYSPSLRQEFLKLASRLASH